MGVSEASTQNQDKNPLEGLLGNYGLPNTNDETNILTGHWKEVKDQATGRCYFWNTQTNEVSWERPPNTASIKPPSQPPPPQHPPPQHSSPEPPENLSEEEKEKIINDKIEMENLEILVMITNYQTNCEKYLETVKASGKSLTQVSFIKNKEGNLVSLESLLSDVLKELSKITIEFNVRKCDWKAGGLLPAYFRIKQREVLKNLEYLQAEISRCKKIVDSICTA